MYHDQGAAPLKAVNPDNNIHYLGGLPLISTSVDLTPRYDIAGQGKADAASFRQAIYQAIDCFRARHNFDAPYANPLPKLFHEKKDDSEKVRFSIPKKREGSGKAPRTYNGNKGENKGTKTVASNSQEPSDTPSANAE